MGALLSLLDYNIDWCRRGSHELPKCDIFVDFEQAAPSPEEEEIYNEAESVLQESKEIIKNIRNFKCWSHTVLVSLPANV